jgi:hypothetical protein
MKYARTVLITFAALLYAATAQAQYQLKGGNFNSIHKTGEPFASNQGQLPSTANSNFRGVGAIAGSAGPISTAAEIGERYPASDDRTIVLVRATFGMPYASGVPRYFMGDEILPPETSLDGLTAAPVNYWRAKPVQPGENIPGIGGVLFPVATVDVTSAATNSTTVIVAAPVPELVVGSTLLGQPIVRVTGNTVTLAGSADRAISGSTASVITPATSYYYSPHAEKVFASQPGNVTITWVTTNLDGSRTEKFSVASTSMRPARKIYWTEGSFDGPIVQITDARISSVNPIYNAVVPKAMPEEVNIPGYVPLTPNYKTLSFDKFNGVGQLHAYNATGRVFVEYLGEPRIGDSIFNFVGSDVVDVVRRPDTTNVQVNLGKEILPHTGDISLTPVEVTKGAGGAVTYYSRIVRANQTQAYYAERETSAVAQPDLGEPVSNDAYNKVVFYWMETADFNIQWPKFQNRYWQRWSPNLADYAHYTVGPNGSTTETGISFAGGTLPQIVFQDDPANTEAQLDAGTQRLVVTFAPAADKRNRSLLKFNNGSKVWYVNLYTQAENRQADLVSTTNTTDGKTIVTVSTTSGLEAGMIVTGAFGTATITKIINGTQFQLSQNIADGTDTFGYTVQSDSAEPLNGMATVGERIVPPPGHEIGGYISGGTGYYPAGYVNPFTAGVPAANQGAVIPVNALPTDNLLTVRWFKKVAAPSVDFTDFYVPGKVGRYTVSFPGSSTPQIVIASGVGTDDLPVWEAAGSIYTQNNPALPGYNPNEEHALALLGRAYALREDLNVTSGASYTSEPFALVTYTDPTDDRPAIHAYKVVREIDANNDRIKDPGDILFDYPATAGTLLVKPYPLPLMPLPLEGSGVNRTSKDIEILGADNPVNTTVGSEAAYQGFIFKDRKGFPWVHRGPHGEVRSSTSNGTTTVTVVSTTGLQIGMKVTGQGVPPGSVIQSIPNGTSFVLSDAVDAGTHDLTYTRDATLSFKLYYVSRDGFFIPGAATQPAAGTIFPFLRNANRSGQPLNTAAINNGQTDEPLTIIYRPQWPDNAPELRVGETLALPKFGLPQVRGQKSAQILYQQSIAQAPTATLRTKNSVTLHDATREKTYDLNTSTLLTEKKLPSAIKTSSYQGKTYFQLLPPHLQQRVYFDPLRGTKGTLVFLGEFHDEIAGEDYLDLNLLSQKDEDVLKDLVPVGDSQRAGWVAAIDALNTRVETFKVNPAQAGSYIVDSTKNTDVGENDLAIIGNPDTAVDSYAITSTGQGAGFVTMVFGNGRAFTPEGDPVQVKVFKVARQLYVGDLKVVRSSNPLDEQVSLRHSADFAGKPEDYEFEWRWATSAAVAPATYQTVMTPRIGNPVNTASKNWVLVSDPNALRPTPESYTNTGTTVPLPRTENIHPATYTVEDQAADYPGVIFKSETDVNFSTDVPGSIVFSAELGDLDGLVLYVNGTAAIAYNAPASFTPANPIAGLTPTGLSKQWSVEPSFFTQGSNTIEVAIYTAADPDTQSALDFRLEAAQETDVVASGGVWQTATDSAGVNTNLAVVGGSPVNPFGGPQFVINDRWFTMRYRPKASANNVLGTPYSRWMPPQFVEGWIKRVLAGINPFIQRTGDLYSNAVNTDVSLLTQAGTRWEGDVALTLDNINDVGLIALYETVLNRGKSLSIDANVNDPDTNNALTLAAGYLNDLYIILGNEAFADAANSTISVDTEGSATQVNSSRFSFEGQVVSSLDEEITLLRGRDDFTTAVNVAPAYNRLYWNYTHGINSGEAIYAVNYNIKEKAGSASANGVIDAADAYRMFPQGHGDAYGHYLTALTGYYKLLTNSNFTWTPRAEAVTVLGQPITIDYFDERKFAAAAGNVARSAEQIVALTYRKNYKDDPAVGWSHFQDGTANTGTGVTRRQGLDEWSSRAAQGAYLHWAVANALVPDVDNVNSGVQKIDRTTVPELAQLPALASSFQTTMDNANAHLNPLGLSPGAIAFDIDPFWIASLGSELADPNNAGQSHYEQIAGRAVRALNNAAGAFNQAASMTGALRNQENQLDDNNTSIIQEETAYINALIDIFGRPYSAEVGPGKLYAQGYAGPDLAHWFIVDRPSGLISTGEQLSVTIKEATKIDKTGSSYHVASDGRVIAPFEITAYGGLTTTTVNIEPHSMVQYNDTWKTDGTSLGTRPETGELQAALQEAQMAFLAVDEAAGNYHVEKATLTHFEALFKDLIATHKKANESLKEQQEKILNIEKQVRDREITAGIFDDVADVSEKMGEVISEAFPRVVGLAADVTSGPRSGFKLAGLIGFSIAKTVAAGNRASARYLQTNIVSEEQMLEKLLQEAGFNHETVQLGFEYDEAFRTSVTHANELAQLLVNYQNAIQNVNNVFAKGNRILAEREVFRQRAAVIIQGFRTKDLTFRAFRNEALEQYRSLFDLASRYTYLAAKSYDYETGLLGTPAGQAVFAKIVASRALGDLTDGVPQSTVSTLGDSGLAGSIAQINADFSVAEGRLGLNNPQLNNTVFSMRGELYRLLDDPEITSDDDAWQQTLEQHIVPNVMADSDVTKHCLNIRKPDGTPVPGIIISFSSTIQHGKNFFGLNLAAYDHNFSPSYFATKIAAVGFALPGYIGMDDGPGASTPAEAANALAATPYMYLIPCGTDYMLAPPLGDTNTVRSWNVQDQALPLPFNLGANDFNSTQFFNANGSLSEQPWIIRKHPAFRPVTDPAVFLDGSLPLAFTNTRLTSRSVWNGQWKLVIPAYSLLNNEQEGLNRFVKSVKDIKFFIRSYSNAGN